MTLMLVDNIPKCGSMDQGECVSVECQLISVFYSMIITVSVLGFALLSNHTKLHCFDDSMSVVYEPSIFALPLTNELYVCSHSNIH